MRLIPNSWGSFRDGLGRFFREFNTCHDEQGQFCSRGAASLDAASREAQMIKPGEKNIFAMEPRKVRRFLYHPGTNQLALGEIVDSDAVWETDLHAEILAGLLGSDEANAYFDEWTRGYIYSTQYTDGPGYIQMDRIYGYPEEVFDKAYATAEALAASGAKKNIPMAFANSAIKIPNTIGKILAPVRKKAKVAA